MTTPNQPYRAANRRDEERARTEQFNLGLLVVSLMCYAVCIGAVIGYVYFTRAQPFDAPIFKICLGSLLVSITIFALRRPIVANVRPALFFGFWNVATFALLATFCALDGGLSSPISYFLVLPMAYLAVGFPVRTTLLCSTFGLLCYISLLYTNPHYLPPSLVLFQVTTLLAGLLIAVLGAYNRDRMNAALSVSQRRLEQAATTDALTSCLNQDTFNDELARESARAARYGETLSLLAIDIDNFKSINDTHGHLMGDQVLQCVGKTLRDGARFADRVGRVGGDEMALLAPKTDAEQARMIAERVRHEIQANAPPIKITLSIGVCDAPNGALDVTTLYWRADQALYRAKHLGRDQVALWEDSRDDNSQPGEADMAVQVP